MIKFDSKQVEIEILLMQYFSLKFVDKVFYIVFLLLFLEFLIRKESLRCHCLFIWHNYIDELAMLN